MESKDFLNRFGINSSEHCIYCLAKLIESDKKGSGEHIIPQNIEGYFKSYDVCSKCKKYFGDKVDQLPLKNSHIYAAMKSLGFVVDNFYQGEKFEGTDEHSNEKKDFTHHKGKLQVKTSESEDKQFVEYPEPNMKKFGKNWLTKVGKDLKLTDEVINNEVNKLLSEYDKLKPGEEIRSQTFGLTMRKRKIKNITPKQDLVFNLHPLVSKIVIFILYFLFDHRYRKAIKNIQEFIDNCLGLKNFTKPYYLGPMKTNLENSDFKKYHDIFILFQEELILIDVIFFGEIHWRAYLEVNSEYLEPYKDIEYLQLTFEFLNDNILFLGQKKKGEKYFDIGIRYTDTIQTLES